MACLDIKMTPRTGLRCELEDGTPSILIKPLSKMRCVLTHKRGLSVRLRVIEEDEQKGITVTLRRRGLHISLTERPVPNALLRLHKLDATLNAQDGTSLSLKPYPSLSMKLRAYNPPSVTLARKGISMQMGVVCPIDMVSSYYDGGYFIEGMPHRENYPWREKP